MDLKDNLPMMALAMVAIVAIVGIVTMFVFAGNARPAAMPVNNDAVAAESGNVAGQMRWFGDYDCLTERCVIKCQSAGWNSDQCKLCYSATNNREECGLAT